MFDFRLLFRNKPKSYRLLANANLTQIPHPDETPDTSRQRQRLVQIGTAVLLFAMVFFAWDLVEDLFNDAATGFDYSAWDFLHTAMEFMSVVGLGFAVFVLRSYMLFLREHSHKQGQTITMLRGQVHEVVQARFNDWGLTPAERDVTLLILKGLSIRQIADLRSTAQGTIKAQSTSIFRKSGVASKTELLSLFMDEFIEDATNTAANPTRTAT